MDTGAAAHTGLGVGMGWRVAVEDTGPALHIGGSRGSSSQRGHSLTDFAFELQIAVKLEADGSRRGTQQAVGSLGRGQSYVCCICRLVRDWLSAQSLPKRGQAWFQEGLMFHTFTTAIRNNLKLPWGSDRHDLR